ncbi:MAG: hypothetical protein M3R61_01450 [Chloroflexota bacterium]|nr:hypothetical protein [Chloroflexota bacterium]
MLALAASYGVYSFALLFVPPWVAVVQAAAFELTYVGLAVTQGLDTPQRKRATGISIGAVAASIIYNTLAGWFHAQPQLLVGASAEAWLCLAVLHGAPLAWVAYLVSDLLLHTAPAAVATAAPQPTKDEGPRTEDEPRPTDAAPQGDRTPVAVGADKLAAYLLILAAFDRDPNASTADLIAATAASRRTVESRRSELVKLGALHKTPEGYRRNGIEITAT